MPRCLVWVQTLLGTGHLRRAMLLAEALAERGCVVTLVNGGRPSPWAVAAGVDFVQIPVVTAGAGGFEALVTAGGAPVDESVWRTRAEILAGLARRADVLVTEMFPFGRRAFRRELLPVLDGFGGLVVASVRDVLVTKRDPSRMHWMIETATRAYHRVLVHGDEQVIPFADTFPFAADLGDRVVHTGFVVGEEPSRTATTGRRYAVVVSAGGGAVGEPLLAAAATARAMDPSDEPWLLVGGSHLPESDLARLRGVSDAEVVGHRDDLPALARNAEVSVSQGGYNTVAEGLQGGARMVLVPFARDGEDEQSRRAARLAEMDIAVALPEEQLTPAALLAAIRRAATRPRPRLDPAMFAGARRSADIIVADHGRRFAA